MARLSGKAGSATINAVGYKGIKNWEIDYKGDAIDVTGMDSSGAKAFIGGLTEWSGSVDMNWDTTQAIPTPAAIVAATFLTGEGSGSYDSYAGNVIVTSAKLSIPVEGAAQLNLTFQGTGTLTIS